MICGDCKYFNDGLCSKHGTRQHEDSYASCGEYEIWDEEKKAWIDGKAFYKKN